MAFNHRFRVSRVEFLRLELRFGSEILGDQILTLPFQHPVRY